jgi:hypothetical protein
LVRVFLKHTREAHAEVSFSEWAAEALVERTSYSDLKHVKDGKHWSEGLIAADVPGNPGG